MLDARGIPAVNHGISGTQSGSGRIASGAPNAIQSIGGVTRFEAEVLGLGYPWDGGGPHPIPRLQAFQPRACDYVYVSIGTNDGRRVSTVTNLRWMMARWVAAGHSPRHFIVTTLAPARAGTWKNRAIPRANPQIRKFAFQADVKLIDLAMFTSKDDGGTWRSESLHVGDGVHYGEVVRTWIADRVSDYVLSQGCQ
jgi:lysophospholipase L1-like esterase